MTKLSSWDAKLVADMRNAIARYQIAVELGGSDEVFVRPLIGDAPLMPVKYWRAQIRQNEQWIANIIEGAETIGYLPGTQMED